MKRKTILSVLLMLGVISASAQTENPRGLYKLQKFFYDDGTEKPAPFEQYKFCGENAMMTFTVSEDKENGSIRFNMKNLDRTTFNYTGQRPMGSDGKGIQIYDSSKKAFKLRWFNDRFKNHIHFPDSSWVGETYSSTKGISPLVAEAIKALTTKEWVSKNKLVGVWRRRGFTYNTRDISIVIPVPEFYKIYTEKNVLMMDNIDDIMPEYMEMHCLFQPCQYLSESAILEGKSNCAIHWVSDSTLTLTWFRGGVPEIEVWDRCGLPNNLQTLFGTNISNVFPDLIQPSVSSVVYPADSLDAAPSFMGGEVAFEDFVAKERQVPEVYQTRLFAQIEVSFVVERDGSITSCEVTGNSKAAQEWELSKGQRTALQALEAEALRVMRLMPRWNPAVKDGRYVRTRTSRKIYVGTAAGYTL